MAEPAVLSDDALEERKEEAAVIVVDVDRLPPVTAGGQVVDGVLRLEA
jgi:hypothetical protein